MDSNDQIQKTIVVKDETMVVIDGEAPRSRLVWRAAGLDVFVVGASGGPKFEQAANLACNIALAMRIPLVSLRCQVQKAAKKNDTLSKEMF